MTGVLRVQNLCKTLGSFSLRNISLDFIAGEYFVLLGPTGAGKSIILETIAGIYTSDQGIVVLDGRDITLVPCRDRGIGMVYQDYMLFPHLLVYENIAFGLRRQKVRIDEIDRSVNDIAKNLKISAHILTICHLMNSQRTRCEFMQLFAILRLLVK